MRLRAVFRIFVTLATMLVAWLVASPAMAQDKAPVCDPRGAIGFAPPPQIQDLEQSLDVVTNDDDCTSSPLALRHVDQDRAPTAIDFTAQDSATGSSRLALARLGGAPIVYPLAAHLRASIGFTSSLERPPRA